MEHQLWRWIVTLAATFDKTPWPTRHDFRDADILAVYFWAVVHDRPTSWACCRANWPIHLRRRVLPSDATMSRRLRTPSVRALFAAVYDWATAPRAAGVYWLVDGKPLVIGGSSGDRDGRCGRAVNGMARGYKVHAILNPQGEIAASEVTAMNVDERVVADRLIPAAGVCGYLLADANYDSNKLHAAADRSGNLQLITPRRYAKTATGTGHRVQTAGRRRCLELWAQPAPRYIDGLLAERPRVERHFANWTNWGGGLGPLPAWVRTFPRVDRWVRAKLILNAIKRRNMSRTYAA
jgi:hypothetical protein